MKKVTKFMSLVLSLAMVLALSACGSKPAENTPAEDSSNTAAEDTNANGGERVAPSTPEVIRIACGPLNGYQNTVYNAIADMVNKDLPGFYSFSIEASTGSAENARLLMASEVNIGTMGLDVSSKAYNATDAFEGMPSGQIRMLYAHPGTGAIVHIIAHPKSDIQSVSDLKGKKVAATAGVMQGYLEDALFGYDMTLDDLGSFTNLSLTDMMNALQDGTIDAFCYGNVAPNTNFTDLATTFGFKLIDIGEEAVAKIVAAKPWYPEVTIAGGTYAGVDNDVVSFAQPTVVCCSADLSDDAAYDFVSTVFGHADDLADIHKNFKGLNPTDASAYDLIPYHNGAARYYAEQGITVTAE